MKKLITLLIASFAFSTIVPSISYAAEGEKKMKLAKKKDHSKSTAQAAKDAKNKDAKKKAPKKK